MRPKQIPPQPQDGGTRQDRFMDLARKVVSTTPEDYRRFVEQEQQEKADKKKPEQSG